MPRYLRQCRTSASTVLPFNSIFVLYWSRTSRFNVTDCSSTLAKEEPMWRDSCTV